MSSGRDEMMEKWDDNKKNTNYRKIMNIHKQQMSTNLVDYLQALVNEMNVTLKIIKGENNG